MHDAHALSFLGITQQVDRLMRQAHRMERGLPANPLVPQLKDSLARWQVPSSAQYPSPSTSGIMYLLASPILNPCIQTDMQLRLCKVDTMFCCDTAGAFLFGQL